MDHREATLLSCRVDCSAKIFDLMTVAQADAIADLAERFNGQDMSLQAEPFGLPQGYIGGSIRGSITFGIDPDGRVST